MLEKQVIVHNRLGIHARPANVLGELASSFTCAVTFKKNDVIINAKSVMGILLLCATYLSKITIVTDGKDEKEAIESLIDIFSKEKVHLLEQELPQ